MQWEAMGYQGPCRGENLIRSEAVDGAIEMISGRLRMALGDFTRLGCELPLALPAPSSRKISRKIFC
jgi:hypothetical protein